ncbi:MAG: DNA replication protein [Enterococcus aquimarinus]|uniref:DNA replication protein n=1 Tax=Enterococcus aquimarinus TaxID=328396 RepID=A0A9E3ZUU1_9ENTE|nr:DNA replication protein [Enterococcus aquimarinus]
MAQRRMFSKDITTSDIFVDMPSSSQLLYFHLGMEADDDGFLGNARMLSRAYGMNNDDLKLLEAKGFVITFQTGVTVIKDWKINNQIRKDRHKPTIYQQEKKLLTVDVNGSYLIGNQTATIQQPSDNQTGVSSATQYSIGKDSIGKDSKDILSNKSDKVNHQENFNRLWELYPKGKKQGKDKAFISYKKAIKEGITDKVIETAIENYKKQIAIQQTELQFIKQGSTWFNQKCWNDEYITEGVNGSKSWDEEAYANSFITEAEPIEDTSEYSLDELPF